jgi:beta-D-xylosidase 4
LFLRRPPLSPPCAPHHSPPPSLYLLAVRDPRWGRNIESAGEDPFGSGEYARYFVQGFEHAKETPYPLQASACCKHFVGAWVDGQVVACGSARCERVPLTSLPFPSPLPSPLCVANELDGWNHTDRYHIDVFVPQQDLTDTYLVPFQKCVEEGEASGIMCR